MRIMLSQRDKETPVCVDCGEHIGERNDAFLMIPGQFFYMPEDGCALFVVDPEVKISIVEIPDALGPGRPQTGIVINAADPAPIVVAHSECLEGFVENDDDTTLEDLDTDLDREMQAAMDRDRDHDIIWGEFDIPLRRD